MSSSVEAVVGDRATWDALIAELHVHRERVGSPSYARIAERIQQDRMDRGASKDAARIARSTVYDAFRLGRSRVNLPLVREIGHALGAEPEQVEKWIRYCDGPSAGSVQAAAPTRSVVLLVVGCVALKLVGRVFVDYFDLPIYLDMVGTAIAAIALGPWRGAGVGLTTNVVGIATSGLVSLPFAAVNVVGALLWGYGVRRWGLGRTLPRFFALNVIIAIACSVVAVPILAGMEGHALRVGHDSITQLVGDTVHAYWVALPLSNVMTSTSDKLISGFIALVAVSTLPAGLRRGAEVPVVDTRSFD